MSQGWGLAGRLLLFPARQTRQDADAEQVISFQVRYERPPWRLCRSCVLCGKADLLSGIFLFALRSAPGSIDP